VPRLRRGRCRCRRCRLSTPQRLTSLEQSLLAGLESLRTAQRREREQAGRNTQAVATRLETHFPEVTEALAATTAAGGGLSAADITQVEASLTNLFDRLRVLDRRYQVSGTATAVAAPVAVARDFPEFDALRRPVCRIEPRRRCSIGQRSRAPSVRSCRRCSPKPPQEPLPWWRRRCRPTNWNPRRWRWR
jgi:hypothetical protein